VALGVIVGLQFLAGSFIADRTRQMGESGVAPALWFAVDYLVVVWLLAPELGCLILGLAALATWCVVLRKEERRRSKIARGVTMAGAIVSSVAAVLLGGLALPSACVSLTRPVLCRTTTFEEALSPNGRYRATVVEVDCGAMSGTNRQVLVVRRYLPLAESMLLYFNGSPSLHLSWSGRTLTISGERSRQSMDHPPPELEIWGGVIVRYEGPNS
jgi:hypothetical protein